MASLRRAPPLRARAGGEGAGARRCAGRARPHAPRARASPVGAAPRRVGRLAGEEGRLGGSGGGRRRPARAAATVPPQQGREGTAAAGPAPSSTTLPPAGNPGAQPPRWNPWTVKAQFKQQPLRVAARLARITAAFGGWGAAVGLDYATGALEQSSTQRQRGRELTRVITDLGAAFVKVGQALSTRPDLCPPEVLEELSSLQDNIPCFPNEEAFALIERELGAPLDSVYSEFSKEPVAAASLGQVYKARLRDCGSQVAVKVQRPGIEDTMLLDFYIVRSLLKQADNRLDWLETSLVGLLDEFADRVLCELDYVSEGRNCDRFRELYGDRPDVVVPRIYWNLTRTRVLNMEWIDGVKLSDKDAMAAEGLDVIKLVDAGIQCSLRQLLEAGYFHADPHPGNLLATRDGKLAFLDFGMMSETPGPARLAIIEHVVHLVNRDYQAMAQDYYALGFLERSVDVSPIVPELEAFFDDVLTASVSELNFKTITDGLGGVLFKFPFNVPPYYALILRSLTVLEGLALSTDPNFKVLAAAYPYMAQRLLQDPTPQLRRGLIELLFKDGTFRWNRLENLLRESGKSEDSNADATIAPLLDILLSEGDGSDEVRDLVEREAVRVTEAMLVGGAISAAREDNQVAELLRSSLGDMPSLVPTRDQAELLRLRAQVLRVWAYIQARGGGVSAQSLQPVLDVLNDSARGRNASRLGLRVAGGVTQRLAARTLQRVLAEDAANRRQSAQQQTA